MAKFSIVPRAAVQKCSRPSTRLAAGTESITTLISSTKDLDNLESKKVKYESVFDTKDQNKVGMWGTYQT